jgi:A/G-specific adenine glycosylase
MEVVERVSLGHAVIVPARGTERTAGGGRVVIVEGGSPPGAAQARRPRARLRAVRAPDRRLAQRFQRRLLAWYAAHGRDLPWRRTRDPYRVLVSEIMLQQTQVDRVLPKYHEFLTRYPTLESLAGAEVEDVRRLWYPLGYNVRPIRLHQIACETLARYGGQLPDSDEDLRRLPGIGRYTAGAILAFAYGRDAAILDTNVRRVLTRVFVGPRRRLRGDKALWDLSTALVPAGSAYDYNQALMDFGATWCTPRRPRCPRCPLRGLCRSVSRGPVTPRVSRRKG